MKRTSALRTPYHSRTIVRSDAPEQAHEIKLDQALALTQLVVLGLCVARVAVDRIRGPLTIEGHMALVLCIAIVTWPVARAIAWATRGGPAETHPPGPSLNLAAVGEKRGRAS